MVSPFIIKSPATVTVSVVALPNVTLPPTPRVPVILILVSSLALVTAPASILSVTIALAAIVLVITAAPEVSVV